MRNEGEKFCTGINHGVPTLSGEGPRVALPVTAPRPHVHTAPCVYIFSFALVNTRMNRCMLAGTSSRRHKCSVKHKHSRTHMHSHPLTAMGTHTRMHVRMHVAWPHARTHAAPVVTYLRERLYLVIVIPLSCTNAS